jgi:hypothetical protein
LDPHRLRTRCAGGSAFEVPATAAPVVIEDGGTVVARGWRGEGRWFVEVQGVGVYAFGPRSVVEVQPVASWPDAERALYATALPIILQASGAVEAFHAGGVLHDGFVWAFCGSSGAGKSTLCRKLAEIGIPVWADDAVAFAVDGAARSLRLPLPVSSTVAQRSELPREAPIGRLFILAPFHEDRPPRAERLSPSEALTALMPHAHQWQPVALKAKRAVVLRYLELVSTTTVVRLSYQRGRRWLPQLLDLVWTFEAVAPA